MCVAGGEYRKRREGWMRRKRIRRRGGGGGGFTPVFGLYYVQGMQCYSTSGANTMSYLIRLRIQIVKSHDRNRPGKYIALIEATR